MMMKGSIDKNKNIKTFIFLSVFIIILTIVFSACADPFGYVGDKEKGQVGDNPKTPDVDTEPPMPVDGVVGYWVYSGDAVYFDKDGTCIMYETFSNDIYEEFWVYNWSYLNDNTIRVEAEVDGELFFEDFKYEIKGNVLNFGEMSFEYYKESKPEICYYDTFLKKSEMTPYWVFRSEDAVIYMSIFYADICFLPVDENEFSYVAGEYVLELDSKDSDFARFTLSNGEEFILTFENGRPVIKNDGFIYEFSEISDIEFSQIMDMYLNKDNMSAQTNEQGSFIDENGNIIEEIVPEYTEPVIDY